MLTVKVEKEEKEEENAQVEYKYAHREFGKFSFEKQFKIPNTVNIDGIEAKFENGILNIIFLKKKRLWKKHR